MSTSLNTSETRRDTAFAFGSTSESTSETRRGTALGFGVRAITLRISGVMMGVDVVMGVDSGLREY
jgi:hypothetical protein